MFLNYFNNIIKYINEHFVSGDFWFDTDKVINSHIKKIKFTARSIKEDRVQHIKLIKLKYRNKKEIEKIMNSEDVKEKIRQTEVERIRQKEIQQEKLREEKKQEEIIQREKLKVQSENQNNIFSNLLMNLIIENKNKKEGYKIDHIFIDKENIIKNKEEKKAEESNHLQDKDYNKDYNRKLLDPNTPNGYVSLMFENIDINKLFIKHNIIVKHLKVDDNIYIKSFILNNEKSEYACDNMGENVVILFREKNDSFLEIIAENILGDRDYMHIINGRLINY